MPLMVVDSLERDKQTPSQPATPRQTSRPGVSAGQTSRPSPRSSLSESATSPTRRRTATLVDQDADPGRRQDFNWPLLAPRRSPDQIPTLLPEPVVADLSVLPDTVQIKEAARTAVLSRRWRPIWRSAPLVLVDLFLFASQLDSGESHHRRILALYDLVSRILAAHPGPFSCVYLGTLVCPWLKYPDQLDHWLELLGIKGVEQLVLISNYWRKPLPSTIFGLGNLTRLHLALWRFPDTAGLPPGVAFPSLRELGLSGVFISNKDLDFLLSRSRNLEILYRDGNLAPLRLQPISHSLRFLQIQGSNVEDIAVVDAPRLERLILPGNWAHKHSRVMIEHAPELCIFGCFEPGKHGLQIGNNVIKPGMLANPSTMVPTVKILAIQVRLAVNNDVKRLPGYLRCFPSIETLHIQSLKTTKPARKRTISIWRKVSAIECVKSRIRLMVFHDFRGYACEISFLKFFAERAQKLETMWIVVADGCFKEASEVLLKLEPLFFQKTTTSFSLHVYFPPLKDDGPFSWISGSNFLNSDPFMCSLLGEFRLTKTGVTDHDIEALFGRVVRRGSQKQSTKASLRTRKTALALLKPGQKRFSGRDVCGSSARAAVEPEPKRGQTPPE